MTTHKLNPTGSTTVDSFEANLIQIEQTNKLLANIENKLNNFFHKNISIPSPLPLQERELKDQVFQEQQRSHPNKEDFMQNIGNTMLSPIQNNQNKDSLQNFMSGEGDLNLRNSNNYIKIIDSSKAYESSQSYTDQNTSYNYKARHHTVESNPITTIENQDFTVTDHNTSESRHSIGRDPYNRRKIESGREFHYDRAQNVNGRKSARYWTKDEHDYKMEDIDKKFYEKKIQILEERLESSEKEVYQLLKVKENMNSELIRLKAQLSDSHNRYIEDLSKSLKSQEGRLRKEFEQQFKYREDDKNEHSKYMDKIENLTKERDVLKQQIHDLKKEFEKLKEEKETATARNSRLLSSHDHLGSHIEYQRNERHLKSPSDRLHSEGRVSVAKSQDTRVGGEQFKALVESLNMYKHELESLRENNAKIQHQFEQEVYGLRNELEHEKEKNLKMAERIQVQNQALGKYQNTLDDNRGRRNIQNLSDPLQTNPLETANNEYYNEDQYHRRHGSVKEGHHEDERQRSQARKSSSGANFENERKSHKRQGRESHNNRQEGEEKHKRVEILERNDAHTSTKSHKEGKKDSIPFTNPNIKSGIMTQERKGRARETLYKELAELQSTPPRINSARAKSRSNSKSNSKRRKASEDQPGKIKNEARFQQAQKSPGTAYEEFEEELKKLKGALNAKVTHKKRKSKSDKENIMKREILNARDKEIKGEKSEKRLSATSRGLSKRNSYTNVNTKPVLAMSAKTLKKKI